MSNAVIIRGMSFEEYRELPGMNCSTLKHGLRSMAHMRWAMDHPREATPDMALGSACHTLASEPEEFDSRYLVGGPINPKTGKTYGSDTAKFAEWIAENANGRTVISQEDYDRAMKMAQALRSLGVMDAVFSRADLETELTITWINDETGLDCKCRLDLLVPTSPLLVPDIKTTQDARRRGFTASTMTYGYWLQAAMYSDAVYEAFGDEPVFVFACVESSPPYASAIFCPNDEMIRAGQLAYRRLLTQYRDCLAAGEWPGYPTDIQELSLPRWAGEEITEQE